MNGVTDVKEYCMGNHASHEKVVQDCQAAIARFRQAMSDGSVNTPEQHEDWELVLRTLRHYLTPVANMLDRHMPGAGEELQQLAYDRLCDHIRSPTYHSLTRQFGSYLKHAKKRALRIIRQRTSCLARLDTRQDEKHSSFADLVSDPQAERDFDSVDDRLTLESALARLDYLDYQIVVLIESKYTCLEIASKFGIAPSTVTRRHKRALARLRSILDAPDA